MMSKIILSSIIISLLLCVSNSVFATTSSSSDQNVIAIEHSSVFTIIDTDTTESVIPAIISTDKDSIIVNFYEINDSGTFKSYFIKFTAGETSSSPTPQLHIDLSGDTTIDLTYLGNITPDIARIVYDNNTLDTKYNSITTYDLAASRGCSSSYLGDADRDGICTKWERAPYLINYPSGSTYNLPSCDPNAVYSSPKTGQFLNELGDKVCPSETKKDVYVEIDWMAGHKPDIDSLKQVVKAFNDAPTVRIGNQDIKFQLHLFLDEEILPHINVINFPGSTSSPGFDHIKAKEFGTDSERDNIAQWNNFNYKAKGQVFNYYIWAHNSNSETDSSGISEQGGNDGGITLGTFAGSVGSTDQQAGTFMHELGHNLNLNHGGNSVDEINCKPNLISVMNYAYQFSDLVVDRPLDYSRYDTPALGPESSLAGTTTTLADPSGKTIVYGIGDGKTNSQKIPTDVTWPANWKYIRTISDNQTPPHIVCSEPTTEATLTSYKQWNLIDLYQKNSQWKDGRSSGSRDISPTQAIVSPTPQSIPLHTQQSIPIFTAQSIPSQDILTSNQPNYYISTDKYEYSTGDDVLVNGVITSESEYKSESKTISLQIIDFDGKAIFSDKFDLKPDGTFETTLSTENIKDGDYVIKVIFDGSSYETPIFVAENIVNFVIPEGQWCLTEKEAQAQITKQLKSLNTEDIESMITSKPTKTNYMQNAPICGPTEITMKEVIASHSINLNNLSEEVIKNDSESDLIKKLENIRLLVLNDKLADALISYNSLRDAIKDISDNNKKSKLLKILDTNVDSLSHSVSTITNESFVGKYTNEQNIQLRPLKQSHQKIPVDKITCNVNLEFIQKYDNSPACVKSTTVKELKNRGWVISNQKNN